MINIETGNAIFLVYGFLMVGLVLMLGQIVAVLFRFKFRNDLISR